MNRTSNRDRRHKPRISCQTLESNDSRREDSKECSDESSDDDDDEEEERSTDRESGETEESAGSRREWEALARYLKSQRTYLERNKPDNLQNVNVMKKDKKAKKDKTTQKNLASPMPSMWKPPVYREVTTAPNLKVLKSKPLNVKDSEFDDVMLRYLTKLENNTKNDLKKINRIQEIEKCKKLCPKHKAQTEQIKKKTRNEGVHTCLDVSVPSIKPTISPVDSLRKPEIGGSINIHSQCGLPIRYFQERQEQWQKKSGSEGSGKVREKLVYVVEEEEGKSVAKMETDLFSVNEIFMIKKDLLELSEFAKKLKKLKEMKKESEKEKSCGSDCHCRPLTELLKDVNKRMEALEARQEDLERGLQKGREIKSEQKKVDESKTDDDKTTSVPPPLGDVKPDPCAVKSIQSFEKTEVTNVSREGGAFSKNLEIVNELLDIKSQLQKLERKRMSKELQPEIEQSGISKNKGKEHGINVFSSKTYILTTDTFNKKRNLKDSPTEGKFSNVVPLVEETTSVSLERRPVKDNVVDWLRKISSDPEKPDDSVKVYVASKEVGNDISQDESWEMPSSFRERNRSRILERKDFENQARYHCSLKNLIHTVCKAIRKKLKRTKSVSYESLYWPGERRNRMRKKKKGGRGGFGGSRFTNLSLPSSKKPTRNSRKLGAGLKKRKKNRIIFN